MKPKSALPIFVAALLLLLAAPASAKPIPQTHPYDYFLHGALGVSLGYAASRYVHPWVGLGLAVAAGIGKEKFDKNYDPRDAFSTIAGGLIGVTLSGPLNPNPKHGRLILMPAGVVYLLEFD